MLEMGKQANGGSVSKPDNIPSEVALQQSMQKKHGAFRKSTSKPSAKL